MQDIHFLNIEYLLLRVYDISTPLYAWTIGFLTGSSTAATAPGTTPSAVGGDIFSHVLALTTSGLGWVALIGMTLSIALLALGAWVRVRLVVVEHEGFHGQETHEHEQIAAHAVIEPKNKQWETVYALAASSSESDWRRAILEADIMLGDMLRDQGYRGEGVGERLRDANPLQFSTLDLAWKAHKVRNDIAHGGEQYHLSQREANATIDFYRRVFEEFNYI